MSYNVTFEFKDIENMCTLSNTKKITRLIVPYYSKGHGCKQIAKSMIDNEEYSVEFKTEHVAEEFMIKLLKELGSLLKISKNY